METDILGVSRTCGRNVSRLCYISFPMEMTPVLEPQQSGNATRVNCWSVSFSSRSAEAVIAAAFSIHSKSNVIRHRVRVFSGHLSVAAYAGQPVQVSVS